MTQGARLPSMSAGGSDDGSAFERIAAGDMSSLALVYDRHAASLLRFAVRLCGRSDAEDLLQATFVQATRIAARYDNRAPTARAWLFGIMTKLAQGRRRSLTRLARALTRFDSGAPQTHTLRSDERLGIEQALAKVTEAKRTVVLLADVEGFTCEQIAEMLDVPVGTVWTRLHHGRRELRAFYEGAPR